VTWGAEKSLRAAAFSAPPGILAGGRTVGAIVDTLHLGRDEVEIIMGKYPDAVITNQTNSNNAIQKHRIIIQSEDWLEDCYYYFLIDSCIAMSSTSFCSRVQSDPRFVSKMRARIAETMEEIQRKLQVS
jgi:hypothetical protein